MCLLAMLFMPTMKLFWGASSPPRPQGASAGKATSLEEEAEVDQHPLLEEGGGLPLHVLAVEGERREVEGGVAAPEAEQGAVR